MTTKSYLDQLQEESIEFRAQMTVAGLSMDLAEEIKELRMALGLSQTDLANLLETKQSRVSKMESAADAHFTLMTLAKLAEALKCTLKVQLQRNCQATTIQNSSKKVATLASSANNKILSDSNRTPRIA